MYEVVNLFLFQSCSYFRVRQLLRSSCPKAAITKSIYGILHTTPVPT